MAGRTRPARHAYRCDGCGKRRVGVTVVDGRDLCPSCADAVPAVGQVWRGDTGGPPLYIVALDDLFAYVKRADSPKKNLTKEDGSYLVARSEFQRWTRIS